MGTRALITAADRSGFIDQTRAFVAGQIRSSPKSELLRKHPVTVEVVLARYDPEPIPTWERLDRLDPVEPDVGNQSPQPKRRPVLTRGQLRGWSAAVSRRGSGGPPLDVRSARLIGH